MSLDGVHHDVKSGGGGGIYETRPCREIRDQSVAYDKKRLTKRGKGKGGKIRGGPIPERTRPPRKLSGHAMRSQVGSLRFRNSIFLSFFFFSFRFFFFSFRKRVIPKFYYELLFLNDAPRYASRCIFGTVTEWALKHGLPIVTQSNSR